MVIGFKAGINSRIIIVISLSGLIMFFVIFSLPNLLVASLEPDQAEKWIRHYLKKRLSYAYLDQLRNSGLSLPGRELAEQWGNDLRSADIIVFESLEIRHFLLAPPTASTRIYMVKVVLKGSNDERNTRYFSLTAKNRFFDFFWVNEHSKWMWKFSF